MFTVETCLLSSWFVFVSNTRVPRVREKLVNPIDSFLLMSGVQSGGGGWGVGCGGGFLQTSKGTVRHFLLARKWNRKNQMCS